MRSYIAFTKKEFYEIWCTYKFFIMISVFLLLGLMNPITAKITPQLLDSFMPEGMNITMAEPTALDSWMQFFQNVPQMGLIVLIIIFSGVMTNEFSRGTLVNLLTKGLSRSTVILAKFTMAITVWTLSYILCFVVTYGYTAYFWSNKGISNIGLSVFCLWIFGVLILAMIMLGEVLFRNNHGGLLFTCVLVVVLMLVNILPNLQKYNPISLASKNMALITGDIPVSDFTGSIVICGVATIIFIASAIVLFNQKQI